jgi:DNA-directed RNA polymerase subunit RPC12/RpoP
MHECKKCKADLGDLVWFDTLGDDFIICPNCGNKMVVCYDESWDGEEEYGWFWVEQYEES